MATSKELSEIRDQLDKLPDVILARFDDRYLKKDDAMVMSEKYEEKFLSKFQAKIAVTTLSFLVVLLGIFDWLLNTKK